MLSCGNFEKEQNKILWGILEDNKNGLNQEERDILITFLNNNDPYFTIDKQKYNYLYKILNRHFETKDECNTCFVMLYTDFTDYE